MAMLLILKVLVVLVNIIIFAMGAVLLALGIWTLVDDGGLARLSKIENDGTYSNDLAKPGILEAAAVVAIVDGSLMLVFSIGAFVGVIKESKCWLSLCAAFMVVLVFLCIIIFILAGVAKERSDNDLEKALLDGIINQYEGVTGSTNDFSKLFDRAQVQFECCGVYSIRDFQNSTRWRDRQSIDIPKTCCKLNNTDAYLKDDNFQFVDIRCAKNLTLNLYNNKSCPGYIRDWLGEKFFSIIGFTIAVILAQLIASILDVILVWKVDDGKLYYDTKLTPSEYNN